jgi:hypothetical protein
VVEHTISRDCARHLVEAHELDAFLLTSLEYLTAYRDEATALVVASIVCNLTSYQSLREVVDATAIVEWLISVFRLFPQAKRVVHVLLSGIANAALCRNLILTDESAQMIAAMVCPLWVEVPVVEAWCASLINICSAASTAPSPTPPDADRAEVAPAAALPESKDPSSQLAQQREESNDGAAAAARPRSLSLLSFGAVDPATAARDAAAKSAAVLHHMHRNTELLLKYDVCCTLERLLVFHGSAKDLVVKGLNALTCLCAAHFPKKAAPPSSAAHPRRKGVMSAAAAAAAAAGVPVAAVPVSSLGSAATAPAAESS